uniref:Apextrin C-terminal domain-containing protein n=1 Tax=Biomphalaria glabrata TaxID=6526 RepID=A0A2C9KYT1_BIOGL
MIQSESTSDIHSLKNSEKSHLSRPLFKTVDQVNYVILRYCVKTTSAFVNQVSWPSGSYCINKKLSCPLGFQEGQVYIDEEDSYGNKGLVKGTVPDDNSSSKHSFCCRNDSRPDTPISLPNKSPFYLNRKGGKCQQVVGMSVEEDFVLIDSENDMNKDEYSGSFNDVKINDVILLCCTIISSQYDITGVKKTAFCEICADGYTVTGLTFLPGSGTYLLRNVQDFNIKLQDSNNVEKQYIFPGDFLPGEL